MASETGATAGAGDQPSLVANLSSVAGRVLDQLSVSAWLPSSMLVGNAAVLIQLRARKTPSVAGAVVDLTRAPLGILIVLVLAVVLTTTVVQAFEYHVIRVLEGYWGLRLASVPFVRAGLAWQAHRRKSLNSTAQELTKHACREAHTGLLGDPDFEDSVVVILDKWARDLPLDTYTAEDVNRALATPWQKHAPPHLTRRIEATTARAEYLPAPVRAMPTRLGNTMRVSEDRLDAKTHESLRSYIIDRWDTLPVQLRAQYLQYRTRLDMYCMLVFVFVVLAAVAGVVLNVGDRHLIGFSVGFGASYLAFGIVSYRAAIFTAQGIGDTLGSIRRATATASGPSQS